MLNFTQISHRLTDIFHKNSDIDTEVQIFGICAPENVFSDFHCFWAGWWYDDILESAYKNICKVLRNWVCWVLKRFLESKLLIIRNFLLFLKQYINKGFDIDNIISSDQYEINLRSIPTIIQVMWIMRLHLCNLERCFDLLKHKHSAFGELVRFSLQQCWVLV